MEFITDLAMQFRLQSKEMNSYRASRDNWCTVGGVLSYSN